MQMHKAVPRGSQQPDIIRPSRLTFGSEPCRDMLQAHNALLHLYASHGKVGKAEQLYGSMQARGPLPDALSAASLIAAYAKVSPSHHHLNHVKRHLQHPLACSFTPLSLPVTKL